MQALRSSTAPMRMRTARFRVPEKPIDWSSHVASWLDAPFPVLAMRYEDTPADPVGQLAGMAGFLGLDGDNDEERLRRAVAFSSFDRLPRKRRSAFLFFGRGCSFPLGPPGRLVPAPFARPSRPDRRTARRRNDPLGVPSRRPDIGRPKT